MAAAGEGTLTATLGDRLHLAKLAAERLGRAVRRVVAIPRRLVGLSRTTTPERLLIAPQDIRTSDPTIAADIGAGYFAFGGKVVNARKRSPFVLEPGAAFAISDAWMRQLVGFAWLRHLRAADTIDVRRRGRALVDAFLDAFARPSQAIAWEPLVAARRLMAWLSQSPVILDGADREFFNRFMRALATHRAALQRHLDGSLAGEDRLWVALALAEFGLCVQDNDVLRRGTESLVTEIDAQILSDGGHISRNPQILIDLLLDLLPLRQAYAARAVPPPPQLLNAIDRMMPMLRLFRHGDGTLALFNGMGSTAPELVATILTYDDARAQPLVNAPYTGYQRIEIGKTIVILDSGKPPPGPFSYRAHAGCLSFELSSALNRIVVNCGMPDVVRNDARAAARSTAAHSTITIDDTSSCRIASGAGVQRWLNNQILAGPAKVTTDRSQNSNGVTIALSHDGYVARFGIVHRRTLTLQNEGRRLDGHDALTEAAKRAPGVVPYVLRFHLHPMIRATVTDDGHAVRLDAPDNESWLFETDASAVVEPSILFAAEGGPRPNLQIAVAAEVGERPEIHWTFQKISDGFRRRG